ncbi:MAG: hypothetical protein ACI37P_07660 [Eggerthellaceae bacterium]
MSELLNDVEYLSQEIGPRPAGTEEEQRAALYIADQVKKQTTLRAEIEDISCISNPELLSYIYNGVAFVALLVSVIFPVAAIPCLVAALLAAAVFLTEEVFNKPLLSKLLARDISQNVVTKYQPAGVASSSRGTRRKIVVVANYDSGKVMKDLNQGVLKVLGPVLFAADIALLASPVLILLKDVLFSASSGFVSLFFLVLSIAALILLAIPLVRGVIHQVGAYNEAANVNASGVAVMMEAMRQVSANGEQDIDAQLDAERNDDEDVVIHGQEAAMAAGVVDEDVDLVYDDEVAAGNEPGFAEGAADGAYPLADDASSSDVIANSDEAAVADEALEVAPSTDEVVFEPATANDTYVNIDDESYEEQSPEDRLLAAKAAIAGLTGTPVEEKVYSTFEDVKADFHRDEVDTNLTEEEIASQRQEMRQVLSGQESPAGQPSVIPFPGQPESQPVSQPVAESQNDSSVPDWFKAAQQKAHRQPAPKKVNRSRYADALDMAAAEGAARFGKAVAEANREAEEHLQDVHRAMSAVKPPVSAAGEVASAAVATAAVAGVSVAGAAATAAAGAASTIAAAADSAAPSAVSAQQNVSPASVEQSAPVQTYLSEPPLTQDQPQRQMVQPTAEELQDMQVSQALQMAPAEPVEEPVAEGFVAEAAVEVSGDAVPAADVAANDASVADDAVAETAAVEEPQQVAPAPIPQIDNEEMRAAVAAIEAERADSRPILEPLSFDMPAAFADPFTEGTFVSPFGEKLVADQVRPAADLAALAAVPAIDEPEGGRTIAMPVVPVSGDVVAEPTAGETMAMPLIPAVDEAAGKTMAMPPVSAPEPLVVVPPVDAASTGKIPMNLDIPAIEGFEAPSPAYDDIPNVVMDDGVPRIVLPELGDIPSASAAPVAGQRAPLAEAAEIDGQTAAKSLLSNRLPKINLSELSGDLGEPLGSGAVFSDSDKRDNLMGNLPSLSGSLNLQDAEDYRADGAVSATGSFAAAGATGAFAPVGDELVADYAPDEMYVEDADDLAYNTSTTETGAFAGPDYVKMPKSRFSRLFGRFGKKKQEDMATPQEWLNVDDDFDARQVGKDRGDWSSFRSESSDYYDDQDDWRGGAFSRGRTLVDDSDPTEENDIIPNDEYIEDVAEDIAPEKGGFLSGVKGKISSATSRFGSQESGRESSRSSRSERSHRHTSSADAQVQRELREVQRFQAGGDFNTEIWFVALGAENSNHAGIKAFIDEHEAELKGSIVVNLEALGAGYLSGITKEGVFKKCSPSTRLKRFLRSATQLSGVTAGTAEMTWRDSTSSYAMKRGLQAISLVGMDGQKPALMGQSDDVLENVEEEVLQDNVAYLMALLRSI